MKFNDEDERGLVRLLVAAVAMHAMIPQLSIRAYYANGDELKEQDAVIKTAFYIADKMLKYAEDTSAPTTQK